MASNIEHILKCCWRFSKTTNRGKKERKKKKKDTAGCTHTSLRWDAMLEALSGLVYIVSIVEEIAFDRTNMWARIHCVAGVMAAWRGTTTVLLMFSCLAPGTHPVSSPIVRAFRDIVIKGASTLLGGEWFCTRVGRSRKAAVIQFWPVSFPRFRLLGGWENLSSFGALNRQVLVLKPARKCCALVPPQYRVDIMSLCIYILVVTITPPVDRAEEQGQKPGCAHSTQPGRLEYLWKLLLLLIFLPITLQYHT